MSKLDKIIRPLSKIKTNLQKYNEESQAKITENEATVTQLTEDNQTLTDEMGKVDALLSADIFKAV